MRPASSTSRWIFALFGAAVLSLVCAISGTFLARANLLQAGQWVKHTSDVELAIASCRIHVRDAQLNVADRASALADARSDGERIRALTTDNSAQQTPIHGLLPALKAFDGDGAEAALIDVRLRELAAAEGALKQVRVEALKRATLIGWLVSSMSAALTVVLVALMLSALYRQSAALAHEGAMLQSIVESMVDGVMAVTPTRAFLHVNRAARRLLGDDFPADSFPKDWRSNLECTYENGSEMKPEDGALARAISGVSTDNLVYKARQRNNPRDAGTWVSATGRPVRNAEGTVIAGVVALRDITEQKSLQDQLRAISMSDELTRLHNRRGFTILAEQHARVAQRHANPFAVVFVDLNGLKRVNDSFGHEAGDQLLQAAAAVLREVFRDSDIIARLGGDEFVALLANTTPSMRETIMTRLSSGLDGHNERAAREAPERRLSFSVGVTFFDPAQPLPLSELMAEADRLMYADKRQQRRGAS